MRRCHSGVVEVCHGGRSAVSLWGLDAVTIHCWTAWRVEKYSSLVGRLSFRQQLYVRCVGEGGWW